MFSLSENLAIDGAAAVLFYFAVYSYLGWLLENSYNLIVNHKFFKANFLFGPFKPMYGIAPVLLIFFISSETHWGVVLLLCFIIPTMVEYWSGVVLQKFFGQRYWDYSHTPLQFQGHICLPFSACWLVLSWVCLKWIHPQLVDMYRAVAPFWGWGAYAMVLYFMADVFFTIKKHITRQLVKEVPDIP
ncbi:putative ABC transporter permease [Neobacillus sp. YIM B02564]|jgi:uncharacterized membrane protein|uniref:ABC transporter permease n=1 Tax=Neobacillus paridis TaxID=2803862 RepID=A0ABS1TUM3_9BACI|nr:putative ABC transporter permease [Neobacillus paridis]MBL4955015.1 putative ABC transporter permease [Neobacillus paridis]